MKRTIIAALILCGVFFVAVNVSYAQVIYGCVKSNGQLSIATGPGQCNNNETPISWNTVGPQGLPGVTAGISAAVWGEFILDGLDPDGHQICSITPSFSGADSIIAEGLNAGECRLTFTLPGNPSPPIWSNFFACFTSIVSGQTTPHGTTCQYVTDYDVNGKPAPIFQCRDANDQAPMMFTYVDFLCVH